MNIIAILSFVFIPSFVVKTYQSTFATGINAISFEAYKSDCTIKMKDENNVQGACHLALQNLSKEDVSFQLEFNDAFKMEKLDFMNTNAPYEITLQGKQSKSVQIRTDMDVSQMKGSIGGKVSNFSIKITANHHQRRI